MCVYIHIYTRIYIYKPGLLEFPRETEPIGALSFFSIYHLSLSIIHLSNYFIYLPIDLFTSIT